MVSQSQKGQVNNLLARAARWAAGRSHVRGLLLVGFWARGTPRPDSDVDLVLLTEDVERYLDGQELVRALGAIRLVRSQNWGAIEERRLLLPSGLEVEVGVGHPSWARIDPVDQGTRRVIRNGARILHDPEGLLASLITACEIQAR